MTRGLLEIQDGGTECFIHHSCQKYVNCQTLLTTLEFEPASKILSL